MKKTDNKRKIVILTVIAVLAISVIALNFETLTGNMVKEPSLRILTPLVKAGTNLVLDAKNTRSSQRLDVFYPNGRYSGFSFISSRGECKFASAGYYDCVVSYRIPISELPDGQYYIQAKDDNSGKLTGNKAFFTLTDSKYLESGR